MQQTRMSWTCDVITYYKAENSKNSADLMKLETLHNTAQISADWSVLLMKQWNDLSKEQIQLFS